MKKKNNNNNIILALYYKEKQTKKQKLFNHIQIIDFINNHYFPCFGFNGLFFNCLMVLSEPRSQ